jgi:glycosyltransferase involved in cell wall biosynthesis
MLLIDRPFPSIYAQWRIEEVKSFIIEREADFLSIASKEAHFDTMGDYYGIRDYNILIFNPRFNNLNRFNTRLDGIKFNGKFPADFLLTKKKDFILSDYNVIYHIFYSRWKLFNEKFPGVPNKKQFVHLYPGGHMKDLTNIGIPLDVNIITTQKYITEFVKKQEYKSYIEIQGACMLQKKHTFVPKKINNGPITVCYSAFGSSKVKGGDIYITAMELYKKQYPNDLVNFISVGECSVNKKMKQYGFMTMENLKKIYNNVDIYVSPERGRISNGWPLGIEAALKGSVLITTDTFNARKDYTFGNDILIIEKDDVEGIVKYIKQLYMDRKLLNDLSVKIQKGVSEYYSFENQQQKIFDFIDSKTEESNG